MQGSQTVDLANVPSGYLEVMCLSMEHQLCLALKKFSGHKKN